MVNVEAQFRAAWSGDTDPRTAVVELLPVRLARACVTVLPVDAAGLALFDNDFRVPLGASTESAATAERLQFTFGEGPCLQAARTGRPVRASATDVQRKWTSLYGELTSHTPFRSLASIPLRVRGATRGALDLYFTHPTRALTLDVGIAARVAAEIGTVLDLASSVDPDNGQMHGPAWLRGSTSRQRMQVWIAMGVLVEANAVTFPNALAVLRAHAFALDQPLDDVAAEIIAGTLTPADLRSAD